MIDTCQTETETAATAPPAAATAPRREYLLSRGITRCGRCGEEMQGRPNRLGTPGYGCVKATARQPNLKGCGRIYMSAENYEEYVSGKVLAWMAHPKSVKQLSGLMVKSMRTGTVLAEEIAAVNERLREMAVDRMENRISKESLHAANAVGMAKLRELRAQAKRASIDLDQVAELDTPQLLADWWETAATTQQKHDLIRVVVEEIRILPSERKGFRGFQAERIEIVWQPGVVWKQK